MFSIMKLAIIGTCLCGAAGIAMSPSTLAVDFSTDTSPPAQEVNLNHIDENEAKEIAIQNAGVPIQDVAFTNVYHKYENGYDIIKVEFKKGDTDYKYEIDTASGTILNVHIDFE